MLMPFEFIMPVPPGPEFIGIFCAKALVEITTSAGIIARKRFIRHLGFFEYRV